ncbi:hypothetical protein EGT74_03600 [Chitinophaga lutea]|uniref:Uncharacterized protein n=1 Tax=Chitinophaga lutea TaxID=2488634 RepID=A0A3N4PYZ8_9BACT|nr:hypothetical protein [Chitinophaga lutea]RPE12645.1 hypothetical protein EGT74_03600 [Chitinophaga lutea]
MAEIKNIEKIKDDHATWRPSNLAFIKSLVWSPGRLEIVFYSQLPGDADVWPDFNKPFFEISMEFIKVKNVKLLISGSELHQLTGFDIIDVSGNYLEELNFEVEDYENGTISFSCEDITIKAVSAPTILNI